MKCKEICRIAQEKSGGNLTDYIAGVYEQISGEPQAAELFREFVEEEILNFKARKDVKARLFEEPEAQRWFAHKSRLTEGYIDYLSQMDLAEPDFYEKAWDFVDKSDYFSDKTERKLAFRSVCMHPLVPYYQVPEGLHMDEEEYREILKRLLPICCRIRFVFSKMYEQRTERASVLADILKMVSDEREKVVLLAVMLNEQEKNVRSSEEE